MNTIKFSHNYFKLINPDPEKAYLKQAQLLEVIKIEDIKQLSRAFLQYDAIHPEGMYRFQPDGPYILLIFKQLGGFHIFTTLRPFEEKKFEYYTGKREMIFNIEFV